MTKTNYIAFYGTLKREFNLPLMQKLSTGIDYVGPCVIGGELYNLGPIAGLKLGDGKVIGELYHLHETEHLKIIDEFHALDFYESYRNDDPAKPAFSRQSTMLIKPRENAWVYVYDGPTHGLDVIKSGQWHA